MNRFAFALLSLALCLVLFGCDNTDDYHTPNTAATAPTAQGSESVSLDSVDAPPLKEGSYSMYCVFDQSAKYTYDGQVYMNTKWNIGSLYSAKLSKTRDGYSIKFTIERKHYNTEYNGAEAVVYDTADSTTKDGDTAVFFDMVGQSFTATYNGKLELTGIKGTDKLYKKNPDIKKYLSEADLKAVAQEVIIKLPTVIDRDTTFSHSQTVDEKSAVNMTFKPSLLAPATLKFSMTVDNDYGLPEDESGEGYSVKYTSAGDYTGTLYMDSGDRLVQSTSNSIVYLSKMYIDQSDGSLAELDGKTTITDTCEITKG